MNKTEQEKLREWMSKEIKIYRDKYHLAQKEFGNKVGVPRANIGSYEEKRAFPKGQVLVKILKLIGYTYEGMIKEALAMEEMH